MLLIFYTELNQLKLNIAFGKVVQELLAQRVSSLNGAVYKKEYKETFKLIIAAYTM